MIKRKTRPRCLAQAKADIIITNEKVVEVQNALKDTQSHVGSQDFKIEKPEREISLISGDLSTVKLEVTTFIQRLKETVIVEE
jgi:hypothetical protein